jgi:hypothetical protein
MEQSKTAQATTNTYATLLKARVTDFDSVSLVLSNSHASKSFTAQILVSNDPQGATASFTALELNASGDKEVTLTFGQSLPFDLPLFMWYDIEVKSTLADNPSTANAWMHAR